MEFPSMKPGELLALLERAPLKYRTTRHKGSHRVLESESGYPRLVFAFHGRSLPPGLVRKILVKDIGLSPEEVTALLS